MAIRLKSFISSGAAEDALRASVRGAQYAVRLLALLACEDQDSDQRTLNQ